MNIGHQLHWKCVRRMPVRLFLYSELVQRTARRPEVIECNVEEILSLDFHHWTGLVLNCHCTLWANSFEQIFFCSARVIDKLVDDCRN
jgi:hypothetical protein